MTMNCHTSEQDIQSASEKHNWSNVLAQFYTTLIPKYAHKINATNGELQEELTFKIPHKLNTSGRSAGSPKRGFPKVHPGPLNSTASYVKQEQIN